MPDTEKETHLSITVLKINKKLKTGGRSLHPLLFLHGVKNQHGMGQYFESSYCIKALQGEGICKKTIGIKLRNKYLNQEI